MDARGSAIAACCAGIVALGVIVHWRSAPRAAPRVATAEASQPTSERRLLDDRRVTPELSQKAREILHDYADAPMGTEIPFDLHGERYVGRIEQHWDRARGPHRGVTLYASSAQ
jgi:hypothetical protein